MITDVPSNHVNINIEFESDNKHKVKEFYGKLERILNSFQGRMITEDLIFTLKAEIEKLIYQYPYDNIRVSSTQFCRKEEWNLIDIENACIKNIPHFVLKKRYTTIDVNNMLFSLDARGVIEGYSKVANPFLVDNTFNENDYVFVKVPIINVKSELRQLKELSQFYE